MSVDVDCVVVGAGVVGLAVARALSLKGIETLVVEKCDHIGDETSSRNSEVIHAGIYYPKDSLKAQLCVRGKHLLYDYCQTRHVPHERLGKLIVAQGTEQEQALMALQARAADNGVNDLEWLSEAQLHALEPQLVATAALLSPSTGIIDSHALMLSFHGDIEHAGGQVVFNTELITAHRHDDAWTLQFGGAEDFSLRCRWLINCAGLHAPTVAEKITDLPVTHRPQAYYCKGHYYALQGKAPFTHLIYPMPNAAGLGIHLTLDLAHQARFGPDTLWINAIDYQFDMGSEAAFYKSIRQYWPDLPDQALQPSYTGIRPKIVDANAAAADFRIDTPATHGVAGLINLFGIESPGLTACLALGEMLSELVPSPQ